MALVIIGVVTLAAACGSGGGNGGTGLQPGINGCTSFTDATMPGASRTINFGGNLGNVYDQKCLLVAVSQMVTWNGSFTTHPLRAGLAPSQSGGGNPGSPNNPIQSTSGGNSATFTFGTAGTYPYYCTLHESQGMFGAVQVR